MPNRPCLPRHGHNEIILIRAHARALMIFNYRLTKANQTNYYLSMFTIPISEIRIHTMKCIYSDRNALRAIFRRSFISGAGSILSVRGGVIPMPKPHRHEPGMRRDAEALRGDWERAGRQLVYAARKFDK